MSFGELRFCKGHENGHSVTLGAAYELAKAGVSVTLYEKQDHLGGHPKTVNVDGIDIDLGFMLFNRVYMFFLPTFAQLRCLLLPN